MGYHSLGCVASCVASTFLYLGKYDDLEVQGYAAGGLEIFPSIGGGGYLDQEPYTLKIKTGFWLREEDFVVEGLNGRQWLKMNSDAISNKERRDLACLVKNSSVGYIMDSANNTAHITVTNNKKTSVHATIKKSGRISRQPGLDVFIHNPPLEIETAATFEGRFSSIYIRGDFPGKNYAFLLDYGSEYQKIAEAVPKSGENSEPGHYFVNIGPRIDIGFVGICAMIVDEMFS